MKMIFALALVAGSAGSAIAAPIALSDAQMAAVVAGGANKTTLISQTVSDPVYSGNSNTSFTYTTTVICTSTGTNCNGQTTITTSTTKVKN